MDARLAEIDLQVSELEGAILAIVARLGPMTSYAVARDFVNSPSEYWSGSVGTVYPALKRLAARGLIAGAEMAEGRRRRTDYVVTPAGRAAMAGWIMDSKRALGIGFDPLRTRLNCLDLLPPADAAVFVAEILSGAESAVAQAAGIRGAAHEAYVVGSWLEARLAMLKAMAASGALPAPDPAP
jgi:DNA-binding PadR family transcriptional regulator